MEELNTNNSTDNSQEPTIDEQVASVLEEPVTTPTDNNDEAGKDKETAPATITKEKDNTTIECPDKFLNEDGTVNVANLSKSYKSLEPLVAEKAAWEKEKAELLKMKEELETIHKREDEEAKQAGYNSAIEMKQTKEVANFEANEYRRFLKYVDEESYERVRGLLDEYARTGDASLMEDIEIEFAPEVNKRIAVMADRKKREFETQKESQLATARMTSIEDTISKSVDANSELFNYEPFKQMFVNTLHKYGENFTFEDAEVLMSTMMALKNIWQEEFVKNAEATKQNDSATDKLAAITGANNAPQTITNADLSKVSGAELDKLISKYI